MILTNVGAAEFTFCFFCQPLEAVRHVGSHGILEGLGSQLREARDWLVLGTVGVVVGRGTGRWVGRAGRSH